MKGKIDITDKRSIVEIISFLLVILWIYTAITKLLQFENFRIRLSQFPFIGDYADILVWLVPMAEIAIAVLFFFPRLKDEAFFASFALLVIFTTYIGAVINFAESIPCSCNGVLPSLSWKEHILFNLGFLVLATTGLLLSPHYKEHH